jgi:hypothetical protein
MSADDTDALREQLSDAANTIAELAERTASILRQSPSRRDPERRRRFAEWEDAVAAVERRNAVLLREGRTRELERLPPKPSID